MTKTMNRWLAEMQAEQERSLKSLREGKCGCHQCINDRGELALHFVVCKTCGNKRCPHATNHRLACTGSNAVGQKGSLY